MQFYIIKNNFKIYKLIKIIKRNLLIKKVYTKNIYLNTI